MTISSQDALHSQQGCTIKQVELNIYNTNLLTLSYSNNVPAGEREVTNTDIPVLTQRLSVHITASNHATHS